MDGMSLAEAKAHLDELVERAEAGETIEIMREGRAVARLVPIEARPEPPRKPIDVDALRRLTSRQKLQESGIVRAMRDAGY